MITTVTTVTTVTTIMALGLTASISIASIVVLILFLIAKELGNARGSSVSLRIARFVGVGIVPLIMVFAVIVGVNIALIL